METSTDVEQYDFVLLKTYGNYVEANIALSMLEEEGIRCYIKNETSTIIMYMASGFPLLVYGGQLERAKEIIQEAEAVYLQSVTCEKCQRQGFEIKMCTEDHGDVLRKLPFGRMFRFFAKHFTKEGTTHHVRHYICRNCGKEYEELPS